MQMGGNQYGRNMETRWSVGETSQISTRACCATGAVSGSSRVIDLEDA